MSGTIFRISSAILRQQRSINLIQQSNKSTRTNPQEAIKKAAQGVKLFSRQKYENLTAGKSREEIVGWVFLGVVGVLFIDFVLDSLLGGRGMREKMREKKNYDISK